MRRTLTIALIGLSSGVAAAAGPADLLYVSPDVPNDPTGVLALQSEVVEHTPAGYGSVPLSLPGRSQIDAVHRMDTPDNWLVSLEFASRLGGALTVAAEPRDVVRADTAAASYTRFFCGGSVTGAIPPSANVDAVYLDDLTGGDTGDLVLSVDVHAEIAGVFHEPADLLRYERTAPGCSGWQYVGIEFDASAVGATIPAYANLVGADDEGGKRILAFDVPSDLAPTAGPTTYLPGQIVSWDGAQFDLRQQLTAWPISTEVEALSCGANPGAVPQLILAKSVTPGDLTLSWTAGCSGGVEDYGIFEGTMGAWTSHAQIDCFDDLSDRVEEVTPGAGDTYYLVVPYNGAEGSYGREFAGGIETERVQALAQADRCAVPQNVTACP